MIFTTGDSHSQWTFHGIPGVNTSAAPSLSITMWHIGHILDGLIPGVVADLHLTPGDTLILSCGEIDCRYHMNQRSKEWPTLEALMYELVEPYLRLARGLPLNEARLAILGVVPPVPEGKVYYGGEILPVEGSNAERVLYTCTLNRILSTECQRLGLPFIDVYTPHADSEGLLDPQFSDGNVHVIKNGAVLVELQRLGLL